MAAVYVRKVSFAQAAAAFGTAATFPNHPEETCIVVDWITVTMGSTAGGICIFELIDGDDSTSTNLPMWGVQIPVAAGDTDTVHCTFPGGFPLMKPLLNTGNGILAHVQGGNPVPPTSVFFNVGSGAETSLSAYIGFHMERAGNRR